MKTKRTIIALFFGLISLVTFSQPDSIIVIKNGNSIKVDGILSPNEWTDADSMIININSNWVSNIYYKHDNKNLLFAFSNLEQVSGNAHQIDILFDKLNNKSSKWDADDLWLHSSHSDCEAIGGYYIWSGCTSTKPDWAANNLPFVNGNDNIEFQISISKIDNKIFEDTLGFSMVLSGERDTYWPGNAKIDNPSTWGLISFSGNFTAVGANKVVDDVTVFPIPAHNAIQIKTGTAQITIDSYKLFDMSGRLVKQNRLATESIDIAGLNNGFYILNLSSVNETFRKKIIIE
jgi:hypothetical protein